MSVVKDLLEIHERILAARAVPRPSQAYVDAARLLEIVKSQAVTIEDLKNQLKTLENEVAGVC